MNDPETRPSTVELAESAAEAVRALNHRTRSPDAFTGPTQLYRLVAELVLLVDGLPQLLNQLGRWLHAEHDADRVRSDNHADPGPTVWQATAQMTDAGDAAHDLAHALARAQQCLAHLGATRPDRTINHPSQPATATRTSISERRRPPVRPPARTTQL
ncbi:MAG TPA: hypothetical protein VF468_05470 [Actinomycetota bacterium]|jgi:hypothetical protein|nr:hypothetical protein [Actinomycetota bacterium]